MEKVLDRFPSINASTVVTFLTDQKNPKYNTVGEIVKVNEKGIFSF